MSYDPTRVTEVPARDVHTGSYLHRQGHPTVNIGTKRWKNKQVVLDLVTPPKHRDKSNPKNQFTMKTVTYDPDDILKVSKLP